MLFLSFPMLLSVMKMLFSVLISPSFYFIL